MSKENETMNGSGTETREFIVDQGYTGYVFVGWAAGWFEVREGEKRPYANMYVLSPVSSYVSEDYEAHGMKAEKKKCLSSEVWKGLKVGDRVKLFFDDKQRVMLAQADN